MKTIMCSAYYVNYGRGFKRISIVEQIQVNYQTRSGVYWGKLRDQLVYVLPGDVKEVRWN